MTIIKNEIEHAPCKQFEDIKTVEDKKRYTYIVICPMLTYCPCRKKARLKLKF
jgi:hypothetical protein